MADWDAKAEAEKLVRRHARGATLVIAAKIDRCIAEKNADEALRLDRVRREIEKLGSANASPIGTVGGAI